MQKDCIDSILLCSRKLNIITKSYEKKTIILAVLMSIALCGNAQSRSNGYYRGFIDAGYSIGVGDYEFGRIEVNTSHGYQFNPYIFLGAGVGLHFMSSYETKDMDVV